MKPLTITNNNNSNINTDNYEFDILNNNNDNNNNINNNIDFDIVNIGIDDNNNNNNNNNSKNRGNDKEEIEIEIIPETQYDNINNNKKNNNKINIFISKIKNIIINNFIYYDVNDTIFNINTMDQKAIKIAAKKNAFEIKNNVFSEVNYVPKVPHQLLTQTLEEDIYAIDTIADNDIHNKQIEIARENALKSINDTIKNWDDRFINHNKIAINKFLKNILDPINNEHNIDEINKINKSMANLFQINNQGRIALKLNQIHALPASNILSINNNDMNNLFEEIYNILKYDPEVDKEILDPNKRIRNGPQVLYPNTPKLNEFHINQISTIIGDKGNRLLLYPEDEADLYQFGILISISNNPNNCRLHWDLLNTPFTQILTLQNVKRIMFELNMKLNAHKEIKYIKKQDLHKQQFQLSTLATNICKSRYNTNNNNKDPFWVSDKFMWQFCGAIIAKARKIYVANGSLLRDICKYAFGKVIVSRTNWRVQSFQIVGDMEGKTRKKLCAEANNMKRAYERGITENIIVEQYKTAIYLYQQLQEIITKSDKLDMFCTTLFFRDNADFNENLWAMYKKTEIAVINAKNSTSTFNLNMMKLKRDMLSWLTVIKLYPNQTNKKHSLILYKVI